VSLSPPASVDHPPHYAKWKGPGGLFQRKAEPNTDDIP
jgi:hypothetical protein